MHWQYENVIHSFIYFIRARDGCRRTRNACGRHWWLLFGKLDAKRCVCVVRLVAVTQTRLGRPLKRFRNFTAKWENGHTGKPQCRPTGDHQTKLYILTCCKLHYQINKLKAGNDVCPATCALAFPSSLSVDATLTAATCTSIHRKYGFVFASMLFRQLGRSNFSAQYMWRTWNRRHIYGDRIVYWEHVAGQ